MFSKLFSLFKSKKVVNTQKTEELTNFPQPEEPKTEEIMIKGNINSKGQKIYHVPNGRFYSVTQAEAVFQTEEEAQTAGYRKSKM